MEQIQRLLIVYGVFLIICGISSWIFIGNKAKTAVISGSISASLIFITAYFVQDNMPVAINAAILISGALFVVFSWRSSKTFFLLLEMINLNEDFKNKAIAFLIISLMAVFSLFIMVLIIINLP